MATRRAGEAGGRGADAAAQGRNSKQRSSDSICSFLSLSHQKEEDRVNKEGDKEKKVKRKYFSSFSPPKAKYFLTFLNILILRVFSVTQITNCLPASIKTRRKSPWSPSLVEIPEAFSLQKKKNPTNKLLTLQWMDTPPQHCELPLRSQIKWRQTTRHHTMPGEAAVHLSQVTAPSVLYQIPFLISHVFWTVVSLSSHPICHLAGSLWLSSCRRTADGATTKDHCRDSFTPPNTWESDQCRFIGLPSFPTKRRFPSTAMQRNSNTSSEPVAPALP